MNLLIDFDDEITIFANQMMLKDARFSSIFSSFSTTNFSGFLNLFLKLFFHNKMRWNYRKLCEQFQFQDGRRRHQRILKSIDSSQCSVFNRLNEDKESVDGVLLYVQIKQIYLHIFSLLLVLPSAWSAGTFLLDWMQIMRKRKSHFILWYRPFHWFHWICALIFITYHQCKRFQ